MGKVFPPQTDLRVRKRKMACRLLSVNVGEPRTIAYPDGRVVQTAIWKTPVCNRVMVGRLNIEGDRQADLNGHGGEQRAVLVYQLESYRFWKALLGREDMPNGEFGENLTVDGLPDAQVCIGDHYQIGTAIFEVSQPRVTCHKLAVRLSQSDMPNLLVRHGRPGFYMRVIREGEIGAGDAISKVKDGTPNLTVAIANNLLYTSDHPSQLLELAINTKALSPGWRESFRSLLQASSEQYGDAGLQQSPNSPPAWRGFRPLQVADIVDQAADIKSIALEPPAGTELPPFRPGQHLVLKIPTDGNESDFRSYSIVSGTNRQYTIGVKHLPGGIGSGFLHKAIKPGDTIYASAPRGHFNLPSTLTGQVVFISAGVGITPLLPMLESLLRERSDGCGIWWIHSSKSRSRYAFASRVDELSSRAPLLRKHLAFSAPNESDIGYDSVGRLDASSLQRMNLPVEAAFFICGPGGFQEDIVQGLKHLGIPGSHISSESFGNDNGIGAQKARRVRDDKVGPIVTFLKSNFSVRWDKQFKSLLELAEAESLRVDWSCRAGVCHRCQAEKLSGDVTYSPEPLDAPSEGRILMCCATPVTDVQLDI